MFQRRQAPPSAPLVSEKSGLSSTLPARGQPLCSCLRYRFCCFKSCPREGQLTRTNRLDCAGITAGTLSAHSCRACPRIRMTVSMWIPKKIGKPMRCRRSREIIRAQKRKCAAQKTAVEHCEEPAAKEELQTQYRQSAAFLQKQNAAYAQFCKKHDLKPYYDRLAVAEWDRSQAAAARSVARKQQAFTARRERNLQFINNDVNMKSVSGLPKKIQEPDTIIVHTVNVNLPRIQGVVPKGTVAVDVYTMAGNGTSTPIRNLRHLYSKYPELGDAAGWKKKSGTVYAKHHHYVVHWYENTGGVPYDEIKLKGAK